jgi:hypothetical protein
MVTNPRPGKDGVAGDQHGRADGADAISVGLQQLFASVADEPIPDEFMALLDRIEAADQQRQDGKGAAAQPATGGKGQ